MERTQIDTGDDPGILNFNITVLMKLKENNSNENDVSLAATTYYSTFPSPSFTFHKT